MRAIRITAAGQRCTMSDQPWCTIARVHLILADPWSKGWANLSEMFIKNKRNEQK